LTQNQDLKCLTARTDLENPKERKTRVGRKGLITKGNASMQREDVLTPVELSVFFYNGIERDVLFLRFGLSTWRFGPQPFFLSFFLWWRNSNSLLD